MKSVKLHPVCQNGCEVGRRMGPTLGWLFCTMTKNKGTPQTFFFLFFFWPELALLNCAEVCLRLLKSTRCMAGRHQQSKTLPACLPARALDLLAVSFCVAGMSTDSSVRWTVVFCVVAPIPAFLDFLCQMAPLRTLTVGLSLRPPHLWNEVGAPTSLLCCSSKRVVGFSTVESRKGAGISSAWVTTLCVSGLFDPVWKGSHHI